MDIYTHTNTELKSLSIYDNGNPWIETSYVNNVFHGAYRTWYEDGRLRFVGLYVNGDLEGEEIECVYNQQNEYE